MPVEPGQAVEAAIALRARQLVPIYYGRNPAPAHVETERTEALAIAAGKRLPSTLLIATGLERSMSWMSLAGIFWQIP